MRRTKLKITVLFLILLLSLFVVVAEGEEVVIGDATWESTDAAWSSIENDPTYFSQAGVADWAFSNDASRMWTNIDSNPSILGYSNTLDSAFSNDPARAMGVINTNVDLLDKSNVLSRFDQEIQPQEGDTPAKIQERSTQLNDNPAAKAAWLSKQYGVGMKDSSVSILNYDGSSITTGGEGGGTYNLADLKEAGEEYFGTPTIQEDGSLVYSAVRFKPKVSEGETERTSMSISVLRNDGGEMVRNEDNIPILHVQGGSVDLTSLAEGEIGDALFIENGELYTVSEDGQDIVFSGTFDVERSERDTIVTSRGESVGVLAYEDISFEGEAGDREVRTPYGFSYDGAIRVSSTDSSQNFWIQDETILHSGGNLEFDGNQGDELLFVYTFERQGVEELRCPSMTGCIIQTPGFNPSSDYMGRLLVKNLDLGESGKVTFTTQSYYDSIDVQNHREGEFSFVSATGTGDIVGSVVVDSKSSAPKVQGDLSRINTGTFDISYRDPSCEGRDCPSILHHWSSNRFQHEAVSDYFNKPRTSFVSCTRGVDCEVAFAQSFGKVIPPAGLSASDIGDGWKPGTTIIISGDTPSTAQGLESTCASQGGCIILRSRDAPSHTGSSNLVLAGHHYPDDDKLWHDPPTRSGEEHLPMDPLYLDDLPEGNVESITFSACNSVHALHSRPIGTLDRKYDELSMVQGWRGTAPITEPFGEEFVTDQEQISDNLFEKRGGKPGVRTWAYKDEMGRWGITEDGVEVQLIGI